MRTISLAFTAALAAAVLAACGGSSSHGASSSVARVGAPAPPWSAPTASGKTLTLESLRGKAVYLNFFASWCPPCNEEAPDVNALQKQFASRGLQVVGVDELEDAKTAEAFKKKYGLVYPAIVDEGKMQGEYSVNGLPEHVFIDRSGVVRKIVAGEMTKPEIAAAIRSIL